MPVPQGRLGLCTIGGVSYPIYDYGPASPRNLVQGMPIGNSWSTAQGEGLQSTRIGIRFMAREKATEVLSATFWNYWLTRAFGSGFDDTQSLTVVCSSGRVSRTFNNAKAESFAIRVVKGQIVGIDGVFLAPGKPVKALVTPVAYPTAADASPLLMFDKVSFGGIAGSVYSATIVYSNNHQANAPLDGTKYVAAWEAGPRTASAQFMFSEILPGAEPVADESLVTMVLNGVRTITLQSISANNPDDLNVNIGQVYQPVDYIVNGSAVAPPLGVS